MTVLLESLDLTALLEYLIDNSVHKISKGGLVEPTEPLLDLPLIIL